jgi:hypothetical protein
MVTRFFLVAVAVSTAASARAQSITENGGPPNAERLVQPSATAAEPQLELVPPVEELPSADRLGEHTGAVTNACLNIVPSCASQSTCGVVIVRSP